MSKSKYYKHPAFGQVYGEVVSTPQGRLVWPYFSAPREPGPPKEGFAPQPPKYEGTLLLDKGDPTVEAWIAKMTEESKAMLAMFNEKNRAPLAHVFVVRDGNDFDAEKYPYYVDKWIVTAKNQARPKFVDGQVKPIEPTIIFGGNLVKFSVTPMVTKGGWSYKLNSVQMIKDDGARYGGGTRDYNAVFEAVQDEGEEAFAETESAPVAPTSVIVEHKAVAAPAVASAPVTPKPVGKKSGLDKAVMDNL